MQQIQQIEWEDFREIPMKTTEMDFDWYRIFSFYCLSLFFIFILIIGYARIIIN